MGNLLGAAADPDPLSTILSSIFIIVLVLFSGFFSATETAFSSVNRTKLKLKAQGGNKSAQNALKLLDKFDKLQDSLRILSGLYGILKPLDLMQPYRLDMGTKLGVGDSENLYEFWRQQLTSSLNKELKKDELYINLASKEYFNAIDEKKTQLAAERDDLKIENARLQSIARVESSSVAAAMTTPTDIQQSE